MVSLNARVGAITLVVGSWATAALVLAPELVPLRFAALMVSTMGASAFADEMGIRKPLNRAGLIAFAFAALAKTLMLLNVGNSEVAGSSLLYAFTLLLALLLWSMAFLHRDGKLKAAGAVGASVTIISISVLIAGHIFVGMGALWGIGSLYGTITSETTDAPKIIMIIEVVYAVWSLFAAMALWTGQIKVSPAP